jgi:protein-S-isoprenylcysteine O-methyltransferase Ste14
VTPVMTAVIALAYASLAWELTILHVPSVASSRSIWVRPREIHEAYSPTMRRVFEWPRWMKAALLILPVLIVWCVFVYPPAAVLSGGDPLGDHLFATTGLTNAVGAMLVVAGRAITLGSVLSLRRADRHQSAGSLTTAGLFRYSRNPGLVGMYMFVSGLWLAAPSVAMLCGMVVYVVHMDFKVRMEEDYLGNTIGEPYRSYRRRTPRYLS